MSDESTAAPPRGLFFTSIPKAGKNLVYSFLGGLGVTRADLARDAAVWQAEQPWLQTSGRRLTYALPEPEVTERSTLGQQFVQFTRAVSALAPGTVLHHHFPYHHGLACALGEARVPIVFLQRDPRDILVSMADYILVQRKPAHLAARFTTLTRTDLIHRLWEGDAELLSFAGYCAAFTPWRARTGVLVLRFEDLVGGAGQGDDEAQRGQLLRLAKLLPRRDDAALAGAVSGTYNPQAGTFYKGQVSRWREESDPRVAALLHDTALRELAAAWGYAV